MKVPNIKAAATKPKAFKPFSYQVPDIQAHVKAYKSGARQRLEGSDMGAGKTYMCLFVAKELGLRPAIICPKPAKDTWKNACRELGLVPLFITNYESLTVGSKSEIGRFPVRDVIMAEYAKKLLEYDTRFSNYLETKEGNMPQKPMRPVVEDNTYEFNEDLIDDNVMVLVDEVHRCKGETSLTAELVIALKRQNIIAMAVSASSACDASDMRALGYFLGHFPTPDTYHMWAVLHGCVRNQWGQLLFVGGKESLDQIHQETYPEKGYRIRIADLPKGAFPETQIKAEAYDMDKNTAKIQAVYDEMATQLARFEAGMSTSKGMHPLTIMLRARQKVELLKVPTFVEMAKDGKRNGCKVLIFVSFKETIWELAKKLKTDCLYYGGNSSERGKCLASFQANKEDYMILNIAAGAESISCHDLIGGAPRLSLISPTWSAYKMSQCFGRPHRAGGKTVSYQRVVYAANTIEDKVCRNVRSKLNNMATLNDGDLCPPHFGEFLQRNGNLLSGVKNFDTVED